MGAPLRPARRASGALAAALAMLATGVPAARAALRLDPGFGAGGVAAIRFRAGGASASAVAAASDGRIVMAGSVAAERGADLALARLLADGSPDPSFGAGGRVRIDLGGSERAVALSADADGGILVLADSVLGDGFRSALLRVLPDGSLDRSFGDQGILRLSLPGEEVRAIGLARIGGAVLVAARAARGSRASALLFRASDGGRLDERFGTGGVARYALAGPVEGGGLFVDGRGRALVVVASDGDLAVLRFSASGALDPSFGRAGVARFDLGGRETAVGIALAADGRAVVVGSSRRGARTDLVALRLLPDGKLDRSFAEGGRLVRDLGEARAGLGDVLLDGTGRIVLAGSRSDERRERIVVVRLRADGELDESFAPAGPRIGAAGGASTGAAAIASAPDGSLLVAGRAGVRAGEAMALARFVEGVGVCGDGVLDPGEECDPGELAPGPASGCCTEACRIRRRGALCRRAAGPCDLEETCDGRSPLCPSDARAEPGRICRPAAGPCDVPEACDGRSAACPADRRAPAGTICRPSAGACDLPESCDGENPSCPEDRKSRHLCRAAVSPCDAAERCDGVHDECPADLQLAEGSACFDGDPCTFGESCLAGRCEGGVYDRARCGGLLCFRVRTVGRAPAARVRRIWLADEISTGLDRLLPPSRGGGEPRPRAVCVSAHLGPPEVGAEGRRAAPGLALGWTSYAARPVAGARPSPSPRGEARRRGKRGGKRGGRRGKAARDRAAAEPSPTARPPRARTRRALVVTDVFGRFSLTPGRPRYVGVPTWLGVAGAALPSAPGGAAHYRCYALARRGAARRFRRAGVTVSLSSEGRVATYDVRSPVLLCAPAAAAPPGEGPPSAAPPEAPLLLCHGVAGSRESGAARGPLVVRSWVGAMRVERRSARTLCLPARIEAP